MDSINYAILNELKKNGRASASEISKKVNLSIPAVAKRIKKLEHSGIIQQYTIKINRNKIEKRLLAFIFITIDKIENIQDFRSDIIQHPSVLECHHVVGSYDYLIKVVVENTQALEDFLSNRLKKIRGVAATNTIITLATLKEEINF